MILHLIVRYFPCVIQQKSSLVALQITPLVIDAHQVIKVTAIDPEQKFPPHIFLSTEMIPTLKDPVKVSPPPKPYLTSLAL